MKKLKMMNEGNQIHNYILSVCENFCDTVLLRFRNRNKLRFRLRFHTVKVTVPTTVPVAQQCLEENLAGHLQGALFGKELDVGALLHRLCLHGSVQDHVALRVPGRVLAAVLNIITSGDPDPHLLKKRIQINKRIYKGSSEVNKGSLQ
jgi:hypothetical protein